MFRGNKKNRLNFSSRRPIIACIRCQVLPSSRGKSRRVTCAAWVGVCVSLSATQSLAESATKKFICLRPRAMRNEKWAPRATHATKLNRAASQRYSLSSCFCCAASKAKWRIRMRNSNFRIYREIRDERLRVDYDMHICALDDLETKNKIK